MTRGLVVEESSALRVFARDEYISEAQEIVEGLARDLLALDASCRQRGGADHDLINEAFRAVHTLKGLSGLFGLARTASLSHHLEDLLDGMRLGRVQLTPRLLDVLFRSIEVYGVLLAAVRANEPEPARLVDPLIDELVAASPSPSAAQIHPLAEFDLDPGLLAILTEYEEHRLRANLEQGRDLFILRVRFPLAAIDGALDDLKEQVKPYGEIVTYLPSGDDPDPDTLALDVLVASGEALSSLRGALERPDLRVDAVARRTQASALRAPLQTIGPPAPSAGVEGPLGATGGRALATAPHASIRGVAQTVRVDIRKLDDLMNVVAELAIVRGSLARVAERVRGVPDLRDLGLELHRLHRGLERHLGELRSGILEVRMVPLGQVFDKLARVVRQLSREHDKEVHLVITGAETEVDKLIVEELSDPLMHMIRNAIDHGIEARALRHERGKPEAGTIALNAYQKGNHVVLEVQDDGAGIDEARVLAVARRQGLLADEDVGALLKRDVFGFLFMPGFTTKSGADALSGRGVGMDVVKTNIAKLGGVIDVQSELGIGTKMTVTLPITLAILGALVVVVAGRRYALPLASVLEALLFDPAGARVIEGREVMTLRGRTLGVCRLDAFFGLARAAEPTSPPRGFVVVVGVGEHRLGLVVDRLIGQQDIVIKPLGPSLEGVRGFAGATELGDQHVGLVLDVPAIVEELVAGVEVTRGLGGRRARGGAT